jgi:hypothetical protein
MISSVIWAVLSNLPISSLIQSDGLVKGAGGPTKLHMVVAFAFGVAGGWLL